LEGKKHSSIKGFIVAVICLAMIIAINHRLRKSRLYSGEILFQESVEKKTGSAKTIDSDTIARLAKQQSPAVVNINTTRIVKGHPPFGGGHGRSPFHGRKQNPFEDFFDRFFGGIPRRDFKQKSLGSGFVINKDGYILTNAHVVKNVDEIKVTLSNQKDFKANLIGIDEKTDIGLIKVRSWRNLPTVVLGDSDKLEVGEWVVAIGNPFGLKHTVTSGIVSAKGRVIGSGPYDDFIQTDASINPGNSGGPLFNIYGEVVGINSAIFPEGQGIGFAIPINMAKEILTDLQDKGEVIRGWLGLVIQKMTPGLAESFGLDEARGAIVSEVMSGSPAEKAGIIQGDVVVEFDGKKIDDYGELSRMAARNKPETTVTLTIIRSGRKMEIEVTLGTFPKDSTIARKSGGFDVLGLKAEDITTRNGAVSGHEGVMVSEVQAGSPADEGEVNVGDIILEINRKKIDNLENYTSTLEKIKPGDTVLLLVKNRRRTQFLSLKIEAN
jgi:serine protease Do